MAKKWRDLYDKIPPERRKKIEDPEGTVVRLDQFRDIERSARKRAKKRAK
jgi:hypothetical protein